MLRRQHVFLTVLLGVLSAGGVQSAGQSQPATPPTSQAKPEPPPGPVLKSALKALRERTRSQTDDDYGPSISFDSKGVEFGPWIRALVTRVKGHWVVPSAADSLRGHVVISFAIHRDGTLTDVAIVTPSDVEAFNTAAQQALTASNPAEPLPAAYPDEKVTITVTFYYNEAPPPRKTLEDQKERTPPQEPEDMWP